MRCYYTDGLSITPGFAFNGIDGIEIAGQHVPFDESLIHSPIGHMGHHIVNCDVKKLGDKQTVTLVAPKHNMWCGDNNDVLLHIQQPCIDSSEIQMETHNNVWRHLEKRAHYFIGDIEDSDHATYWEALVQLRWGSSITVEEKFSYFDKPRRKSVRRKAADKVEMVVQTTYSFDGKRISIATKRFQNGVAID